MIYLGTLGRMVGVKCPASQRVAQVAAPTFRTTLEGRVKAQLPPRSDRRTWDLAMSDATTPEHVATLLAFTSGAWGKGPFVFVSAEAPFTNLLMPGVADLMPDVTGTSAGLTHTGPAKLAEGGWAARSITADNLTRNMQFGTVDSPVIPGSPVTASAWVRGSSGYVLLQFFDLAGGLISGVQSPAGSTDATLTRLSVSATVPALAVAARISARSAYQTAQPAFTWTASVEPWSAGQGCDKAVVHGSSRDLVLAGPGRTYGNLSFTATEVG